MDKLTKLKKIIRRYGSCVIAFSGGVDSTFLLAAAAETLPKEKILAVTANSPTYPKEELRLSKKIARQLGLRHKIIQTDELKDGRFVSNPPDRCYFCKKELFSCFGKIAGKHRLKYVFEASTLSDEKDFRPGTYAVKELGIRSPLKEAGLSKEEVRMLSKKMKLTTWNKPSLACLASRIPYGTKISEQLLERVHKGEAILRKIGFTQVRLRHYNGLCRIEVLKQDIPRLLTRRNEIVDKLKNLGYNYITVDLEGYRTGSMNLMMGNSNELGE
jgi:uncharacterized protein